jgi:hypothetical protein
VGIVSAGSDGSSADLKRQILTAAGYVFDAKLNLWTHAQLDRALDGNIAAILTKEQISEWIAAGVEYAASAAVRASSAAEAKARR